MKVDKFIKLKLVKIWEILSQETDEEHPMSTQELLDKLAEMGIPCDTKDTPAVSMRTARTKELPVFRAVSIPKSFSGRNGLRWHIIPSTA